MTPNPRRAARAAVLIVTGMLAAGALTAAGADAGASPVSVAPYGTVKITMKGNGHGHGLSQYGAQGAALAGRNYRQIISFYYPHTTMVRLPRSWIRVRLSGFGSHTSVLADSGLHVQGMRHALPTRGVHRYRFVAGPHRGVVLQQLRGHRWHNYRYGLPNGVWFHRSNYGSIRLFAADGTSTRYRGSLRAFRNAPRGSSRGVYTVNRVSLDRYTAGVVPREMPSYWQRAATNAQAVAARTYGRYGVRYPRGRHYDICDTTSCQVYGGMTHFNSHGQVLWRDLWRAAKDTSNRILRYHGNIVFAQFSASNGGWSAYGGQPYLVGRKDPFDTPRSGDPYVTYSRRVRVSTLGGYFGIGKLTSITITRRDGHGTWGGRVEAVTLSGTTRGHRKTVHTDGYGMQAALGMGTTLFQVSDPRR